MNTAWLEPDAQAYEYNVTLSEHKWQTIIALLKARAEKNVPVCQEIADEIYRQLYGKPENTLERGR